MSYFPLIQYPHPYRQLGEINSPRRLIQLVDFRLWWHDLLLNIIYLLCIEKYPPPPLLLTNLRLSWHQNFGCRRFTGSRLEDMDWCGVQRKWGQGTNIFWQILVLSCKIYSSLQPTLLLDFSQMQCLKYYIIFQQCHKNHNSKLNRSKIWGCQSSFSSGK
jgi:hypothetical protein